MRSEASFFVDIKVPKAVLLSDSFEPETTLHPNECDAVWYCGESATINCDADGAVQSWTPQENLGLVAVPVKPNENTLRVGPDNGLVFQSGVNSGLVINAALIEAAQFSCAVRYSSPNGDARTLLTVNPPERDNYLFLSEKDGQISWQDQGDRHVLSLPSPKGCGWVIAGFNNGKMTLSVANEDQGFSKPVSTELQDEDLLQDFDGINDVFIGCRSHRKGILKTLGSSCIYDVLLWIDQDVSSTDLTRMRSVCRHCESKGEQNAV